MIIRLAPRLPHPWFPGEPADLSRAPERPDPSVLGSQGITAMFPGAVLGRAPTGSARVVAEGGVCLEQLVPREAGPAKMIQAILVFNNHGKPRLVRFYQRFVSAARPVTHPRPFPSPRRAAALASTSGSGTVHDPPPHPPGDPALLCSDTFPWVLGQTRYTVCLTGILDDKNHCL